jgi:hypothetical protein
MTIHHSLSEELQGKTFNDLGRGTLAETKAIGSALLRWGTNGRAGWGTTVNVGLGSLFYVGVGGVKIGLAATYSHVRMYVYVCTCVREHRESNPANPAKTI